MGRYMLPSSEVLLSEEESRALGLRVLVGHLVQQLRESRRAAEEHSDVSFRMLLDNGWEDTVPVGPAEVRGRTQRGNRILFGADILDDDVVHLVFLDLGGKVDIDLNPSLRILFLDSVQE